MFRYRKAYKTYKNSPKESDCPFCNLSSGKERIVKATKNMNIVVNIFAYDIWEMRDVKEHLMIVPKRHVQAIKELTTSERKELVDLAAEYEAQNYNVYARAKDSVEKSVPQHQHTHLIKTANKSAKFSIYLKKPYLLIKF